MEPIPVLRRRIISYYNQHGRDLPWRHLSEQRNIRFYQVWISEVMLQQTQVSRVIQKYVDWMQLFPNIETLASSSLSDVLIAWQGLGYNRRAKYIWQTAILLSAAELPNDLTTLNTMPGIGKNTAAAIAAYCDDVPVIYVETNIRTIIIHHLYSDKERVSDKDILASVSLLLPKKNFRRWYWALMDYGSYLKSNGSRSARQAKTYARQSKFSGSKRQLRGQIIKALSVRSKTTAQLQTIYTDERLSMVLAELQREGLIIRVGDSWSLP